MPSEGYIYIDNSSFSPLNVHWTEFFKYLLWKANGTVSNKCSPESIVTKWNSLITEERSPPLLLTAISSNSSFLVLLWLQELSYFSSIYPKWLFVFNTANPCGISFLCLKTFDLKGHELFTINSIHLLL